ncbi:MAG: response regulator [Actinomycetota bacterium]
MPDILIAADADFVVDEVVAAVSGPDADVRVVRRGSDVRGAAEVQIPDLVVCDLQIGTMGGMAVTIDLRHEAGAGRLPHVPVLMLLDRQADVYLARRSGADAWMVKPLDAFRVRRAVDAALAGAGTFEGVDEAEWPALRAAARGEEPPPPPEPEPEVDEAGAEEAEAVEAG